MLYLIYLVLSYKYTEYKIYRYVEELSEINIEFTEKIEHAKQVLENKSTKAYKNKILKSEQGLKNKWEEVVFLITEKKYNTYTQDSSPSQVDIVLPQSLLDEKSLLSTMTIYQKWIYLIFKKDIR